MKNVVGRLSSVAFALAAVAVIGSTADAQAPDVSVSIDISTTRAFVPLQSYTDGETDTAIIFFGGLADLGLHTFGDGAFPIKNFNRTIYLVDKATGNILSSPMTNWSTAIQDAIAVTAPSSVQYGDTLYIYGGYGPDNTGTYGTRASVTTIDLAQVEDDIRNLGEVQAGSASIAASTEAKVAGAGIIKLDDGNRFVLFGGGDQDGEYPDAGDPIYADEAHIFDRTVSMTVPVQTFNDGLGFSSPLHRRDVNLLPLTLPGKSGNRAGYAVMCGAFESGIFLYRNPLIWADGDTEVFEDETYEQKIGAYEGPTASFYSEADDTNYILNMAGISAFEYDNGTFTVNFSSPWTQEAAWTRIVSGVFTDEVIVGEMPWPLTNAHLVLEDSLPKSANGQILFDELPCDTPVLIGRIYGGIGATMEAEEPPTFGSDDVYDVTMVIASEPGTPATLDSFTITNGNLLSGGLADLTASDDSYLRINSVFGFLSSQPNLAQTIFSFTSPDASPESLDLRIEARLNNPGGSTRVWLRDWDSGSFDTIADYSIGTSEMLWEELCTESAGYVRASDNQIDMRVRHVVIATFSLSGFQARYDLVEVEAN